MGADVSKFPTVKQFTSWLGLWRAPVFVWRREQPAELTRRSRCSDECQAPPPCAPNARETVPTSRHHADAVLIHDNIHPLTGTGYVEFSWRSTRDSFLNIR